MVQLNNTFKQLAVRDDSSTRSKAGPAARTKQTSTSLSSTATTTLSHSTTTLLDLISRLTSHLRRSNQFTPTLQHVKSLLYNKEYLAAFGTESEEGEKWREIYFARWTPARAVLYERAFRELEVGRILGWEEDEDVTEEKRLAEERRKRGTNSEVKEVQTEGETKEKEVIMIGSGAGAELLALGCLLGSAKVEEGTTRPKIKVKAIDQGNWGELVRKMDEGMKEEWTTLSEKGMELDFVQGDLLAAYSVTPSESTSSPLPPLDLDLSSPKLSLVTILFTITELLLQSRLSTLRFLSTLTASAPKGLHLLIIESASLALIPIGTSGRTYPLGQLLDHALCGGGGGQWEIVKSEEAKWFRMPEGAEDVYNRDIEENGKGIKVKLENSRVVLRLYRKL
ncbi:25S rRNA (uracil2843-N3)-methyltransferase [Sporobolomyces salmoneus]|uniref:25S rRNA (uracil2843-N3)-methyltransferase n=1 Tax=Sporobolomyces salmoneus TaxID=183962 RepID=UPI00317514F4